MTVYTVSSIVSSYDQLVPTLHKSLIYVIDERLFYISEYNRIYKCTMEGEHVFDGTYMYIRERDQWDILLERISTTETIQTSDDSLVIYTSYPYYITFISANIDFQCKHNQIVCNIRYMPNDATITVVSVSCAKTIERKIRIVKTQQVEQCLFIAQYDQKWNVCHGPSINSDQLTWKSGYSGWLQIQFQFTLDSNSIMPSNEAMYFELISPQKKQRFLFSRSVSSYVQVNIDNSNIGTFSGNFIVYSEIDEVHEFRLHLIDNVHVVDGFCIIKTLIMKNSMIYSEKI